ncbi:MAG: CHAD domain-containing protein [Candidatus Omnitrophota bacterium]
MSHETLPQKTIQKYLKHLLKESEGVARADDIEYLHRMRVATRKLRTAFKVFKDILPGDDARRWRREVVALADVLGEARELDVHMEALKEFCARRKEKKYRVGTDELIAGLRQRRRLVQKKVRMRLARYTTRKHPLRVVGPSMDTLTDPVRVRVTTRRRLMRLLLELLTYEKYVLKPGKVHELHQMRIAAKHLRYALEILRPIYGEKMDRYIRSARKVQRALGRMHDLDTWIVATPALCGDGEVCAEARYAAGRFIESCEDRRVAEYRKFVCLWNELIKRKTWVGLEMLVG